MSSDTLIALIGFAFVMSLSPGPSNFLLLTSGVNFGFARTMPLILGICCGFLTIVLLVGVGLGQLFERLPIVYLVLRLVCIAYVVWLAWKIGRSRSIGSDGGTTVDKPIGFIQGALFQIVNPKAWAVALIVTVSYTSKDSYLASLLLLIVVFALVNIPSISVWAVSGVALKKLLGEGKAVAVFNIVMALLLLFSMIPVLLKSFL